MTRPTVSAAFSTNTNASAGPEAGLSTRLDPGAGLRAEGFYGETRLPVRAFNFLLGLVGDWIGYLDNFVKVLDLGGTLLPQDKVNFFNGTGKTTNINGTVFQSNADGGAVTMTGTGTLTVPTGGISTTGNISATGTGRFAKRVGLGSAAAGVVTYALANYDLIFLESTGAASGTIWKIDGTGANNGEMIRFVYMNASFGVVIQDPSGTNLVTLQFGGGNCYAVTVLKSGSSWIIVDRSFH